MWLSIYQLSSTAFFLSGNRKVECVIPIANMSLSLQEGGAPAVLLCSEHTESHIQPCSFCGVIF